MAWFPLYADADIHGVIVDGLKARGWDLVRAVDLYPEGTDDPVHFERAVRERRVLVSNDLHQVLAAEEWARTKRWFPGLIYWRKEHERLMSIGDFLAAFEAIAAQPEPFAHYPIIRLKPNR